MFRKGSFLENLQPKLLLLRRLVARISIRMLGFNILLVFLPIASFLYLDTYEKQLLQALELTLVQQGRLLSASLSGRGDLKIQEVLHIFDNLKQEHESRIRVVDKQGKLLADSSQYLAISSEPLAGSRDTVSPSLAIVTKEPPTAEEVRSSFLYSLATYPIELYRRLFAEAGSAYTSAADFTDNIFLQGPEIEAALAGRFGAATRISSGGQRSVNLYVALPIRDQGQVVGAVVVSQSTYRILGDMYLLRLDIFKIFLASLAVAIICSLFVAMTITRPIHRLKKQAEMLLDTQGRLKTHLVSSQRADEIGDLSLTLEKLTAKLKKRTDFIEAFAADVSHEFKNPLASIRSAAELVQVTREPGEQAPFLSTILKSTARMERLLSQLKEMTQIDSQLENEEKQVIDLYAFVREYGNNYNSSLTHQKMKTPVLRLISDQGVTSSTLPVYISPLRLAQVLDNLLENALSFNTPEAPITMRVEAVPNQALLVVEDSGPGIPAANLERIFDRFFSYRPSEQHKEHMGLGLSIVKAIIEGYGGIITAANKQASCGQAGCRDLLPAGAVFTIRFPLHT